MASNKVPDSHVYTGDMMDSIFDAVNRVDQPLPESSSLPYDQEDDIEIERRLRRAS